MKAEVKNSYEGRFEPVVITLTLETANDLREMYHRLNPNLDIITTSPRYKDFEAYPVDQCVNGSRCTPLWRAVNKGLKDRGISR